MLPVSPHRLEVRVYYEDTDAGGIVYHARYLAFAERARTEAMRAQGASHDALAKEHGLFFVVRRVEMDYLRPARLDELLVIETSAVGLGGASVVVRQAFSVGYREVAVLRVKLACIGQASGRPAAIPARWAAMWQAELAHMKETKVGSGG